MGYWGEGIFQNDTDLDNAIYISRTACEIAGDAGLNFNMPRNREELVTKLNNGLFVQLLQRFLAEKNEDYIVLLGALAMKLGATVNEDAKKSIRASLHSAYMHEPAKKQVMKGLKEYKNNGEAWNFNSSGLLETAAMKMADEAEYDPSSKSYDPRFLSHHLDVIIEDFFMGADVPVPGASMSVIEMREKDERMEALFDEWDQEAKGKETDNKTTTVNSEQNWKTEAEQEEG